MLFRSREDGASDIHLIKGLPPKYRKDGQLENMTDEPLSAEDCVAYAKALSIVRQSGVIDYKTFPSGW